MLVVTSLPVRRPRVVVKVAMDVVLAGRIDDYERPDAPFFATGERAGEQDHTLVCEDVHERGVIVDPWLLEYPFPVDPGRSGLTNNGEVAHFFDTPLGSDSVGELVARDAKGFGRNVTIGWLEWSKQLSRRGRLHR